jgi:hypothetical protein
MTRQAFEKIKEGLEQAIASAKCEHAFVVETEHDDGSPRSVFCPRCECSFRVPTATVA